MLHTTVPNQCVMLQPAHPSPIVVSASAAGIVPTIQQDRSKVTTCLGYSGVYSMYTDFTSWFPQWSAMQTGTAALVSKSHI